MFGFEPSEDQKTLVESVRRFAARELRPASRAADESGEPAERWTQAGWELALLAASLPEEHGGFGQRSVVTGALFCEELGWGDAAGALAVLAPSLVALPVLLGGTAEQKAEILPAFAGDAYAAGSAAWQEPCFDFDPRALNTQARRENGSYLLDGVKCNVPYAAESEWMVVYAAVDGATQPFLVRKGSAGLQVKERERNMGLRALPLYSVELKECRVPAGARIGGDKGCDVEPILNASRVAQSALAVGVARAAYEYALDYAKTRQAFGEMIAQRQAIAFMLAEMATEIESARLLVWEAAWRLDEDADATREACLAKSFVDDMALAVTDRAVQVLGGHGYIADHPVEMWLRNGRGFGVLEGLALV
ncbi:MAG TPA: acyl-CoA dehydrogenase family protein [Vicinamibacteria bacterium]|nr:acyl-CoA dehydrogenase family protein [Vicinamibacteria bacterium]